MLLRREPIADSFLELVTLIILRVLAIRPQKGKWSKNSHDEGRWKKQHGAGRQSRARHARIPNRRQVSPISAFYFAKSMNSSEASSVLLLIEAACPEGPSQLQEDQASEIRPRRSFPIVTRLETTKQVLTSI